MTDAVARVPFDLRLIEPFVVLADEGMRFPAAAARLGVGASALSRQVARLQRELGTTLVGVEGRTHVLTPAGQRFLVDAKVIRRRLIALNGLGALALSQSLRIHVGRTTLPSLERMIADYIGAHPGVDVDVLESPDVDAAEAVVAGAVDIGINLRESCPPDGAFALLDSSPLGVLTPVTHPIAVRGSARWTDLEGAPLMLGAPRAMTVWNALVNSYLDEFGVTTRNLTGSLISRPQYMLPAVERGDILLLRPAGYEATLPPSITWTRLDPPRPNDVGLIWLPGSVDAAALGFIDFALDWVDRA